MSRLFSCFTISVSHGEPSSTRRRSVDLGTLVISCVARRSWPETMPVSCADDKFPRLIGCRGRPSPDRQEQRPVIEALAEPVIGLVDVITGGTNIRLNVTCGEGTAEFAKAESTDTQAGQEGNGRLGPSPTELPRLNAQVIADPWPRRRGAVRALSPSNRLSRSWPCPCARPGQRCPPAPCRWN
jgi:hypothetical protein